LSERHNPFLRPLKKKGFKEERVTTMGVYDIGTSHDPGIQQEPSVKVASDMGTVGTHPGRSFHGQHGGLP
jgi:hypothetical protein